MDYVSTNSHPYSRYFKINQPIGCHLTQTLTEAAEERSHQRIFVTHQISTPRDISFAMRNQFNSPTKDGTETTNEELDVQVQIEQAVMVDYDRDPVYGRENYRKPRVIWDKKQGATNGDKPPTEQNQWELANVKNVAKTDDTV